MALLKKFVDNKGMQTTYHRISCLTVYPTYIFINVASYLNEEYRLIEKEYFNSVKRIEEIKKILSELTTSIAEAPVEEQELMIEENSELVSTLSEELDVLLNNTKNENSNLSLNSYDFTIPFDVETDNFGFSDIYSIIKQHELFIDAVDC